MFHDQAIRQSQSQPGAFEFFGGKEWFQNAVAQRLLVFRPFIVNGEDYARNLVRSSFPHTKAKAAIVR